MVLVNPDFSECQDELKPGTYKVRVKNSAVKDWPSGGKYVNWEMETFGESEPKNNGRRIFHKTSIDGKAAFQLQKFYKAATGRPATGEFDTEELMGKELVVTIADGVNRKTGELTGYTEVSSVKPLNS